MNLQQLLYFVTLAEHLNFTKAANVLYITQSGLSKHISDLENQFGVQLFVRNSRQVSLTNAGQQLLPGARHILESIDVFTQRILEIAANQKSSLKIGYAGPGQSLFLPKLFKRFKSKFPLADLTLSQLSWESVNSYLLKGEIDIAFTPSFGIKNLPNIMWEPVLPGSLIVAVSKDHFLADLKSAEFSILANEQFLTVQDNFAINHFQHVCLQHGFSPKIVKEVPSLELAYVLVEAGVGILMMSSHLIGYGRPNICFVDINIPQDLGVAWKKDNPNPSIPFLLEELKAVLADSGPDGPELPQTVNL